MNDLSVTFDERPEIGDSVFGSIDFGVSFRGVVIFTQYNCETRPGAFVNGEISVYDFSTGEKTINNERFFVPVGMIEFKKSKKSEK